MATVVLIPGAGSSAWYWHLVVPELARAGHTPVAVDLPCTDETAGFDRYADVVVDAIDAAGGRSDVVLVAQSMGGFTAPLVCERVPVTLMVLVAAMVPKPGESGGAWWEATGHAEAIRAAAIADGRDPDADDEVSLFLHDLPADVVAASEGHVSPQSGRPFADPFPLAAWPDVPTRFVLCRDDRFFPAGFQRRVVAERLPGVVPDEMDGGHLPALARPRELAELILSFIAAR